MMSKCAVTALPVVVLFALANITHAAGSAACADPPSTLSVARKLDATINSVKRMMDKKPAVTTAPVKKVKRRRRKFKKIKKCNSDLANDYQKIVETQLAEKTPEELKNLPFKLILAQRKAVGNMKRIVQNVAMSQGYDYICDTPSCENYSKTTRTFSLQEIDDADCDLLQLQKMVGISDYELVFRCRKCEKVTERVATGFVKLSNELAVKQEVQVFYKNEWRFAEVLEVHVTKVNNIDTVTSIKAKIEIVTVKEGEVDTEKYTYNHIEKETAKIERADVRTRKEAAIAACKFGIDKRLPVVRVLRYLSDKQLEVMLGKEEGSGSLYEFKKYMKTMFGKIFKGIKVAKKDRSEEIKKVHAKAVEVYRTEAAQCYTKKNGKWVPVPEK